MIGTPSPTLSRRRFLAGLAAAGTAVALTPLRTHGGGAATADWERLARSFGSRLLRPGDPGFAAIAQPWALQYAGILPAGIARAASVDDVATALLWAQEQGLPLVARSGGHSYAAYSTTTGLMIDVSLMNGLAFDRESGRATVGGGARNATLYSGLRPYSTAVTHGRCKEVGVAGLVLGGGIGFNMRHKGLTCDQLVETQVVTASGQVLTCNASQNSDLYWACLGGGGGNFGINTSFTFQTFPVGQITFFNLAWTEGIADLLPALEETLVGSPTTLGAKVSVVAQPNVRGGAPVIQLLGQLVGTQAELAAILRPVYAVAEPAQSDIRTLGYWDAQELLSEAGDPEYSHERSRYMRGPVGTDGYRTVLDYLAAFRGQTGAATWKYFLTGGAIDDAGPAETAYVHRGARGISSIDLEWEPSEPATNLARSYAWLDEFHAAMAPYTSGQAYQNFIDDRETSWQRAYYGQNFGRLVEVKRRYDPGNVFRFQQSIPLSA